MKRILLTATLALAAFGPASSARAESFPQILGNDPLTRQILAKTAQDNGGVSAAVRVGSGQIVLLNPADIAAGAARAVALAPAATSASVEIKPAAGLAVKKAKTKGRPIRRAVDQLKRASAVRKAWTDGR
jgi:hypothetical protein